MKAFLLIIFILQAHSLTAQVFTEFPAPLFQGFSSSHLAFADVNQDGDKSGVKKFMVN